jgi:hypothetical protein
MRAAVSESSGGRVVAKDKNKKKGKKSGAPKASDSLKALAKNPLVADVVAAALVATASALKDSKRARALASDAGDEIAKLSKAGAKQGEVLWDMAMQIGRRSIEALMTGEDKPNPSKAKKAKAKPAAKKTASPGKKTSKKKPASASKR